MSQENEFSAKGSFVVVVHGGIEGWGSVEEPDRIERVLNKKFDLNCPMGQARALQANKGVDHYLRNLRGYADKLIAYYGKTCPQLVFIMIDQVAGEGEGEDWARELIKNVLGEKGIQVIDTSREELWYKDEIS